MWCLFRTVSRGIMQKTGTPVSDSGPSAAGCEACSPSGATSSPTAAVVVICGERPSCREDGPGTTLELLCGFGGAPMPAPRPGPVSTSGPVTEDGASTKRSGPFADDEWLLPLLLSTGGLPKSDWRSSMVRRLRRLADGTGGRVHAGRSSSAVRGPLERGAGEVPGRGDLPGTE